MNSHSHTDYEPSPLPPRHHQAVACFLCGLAFALVIDACVVRWALSGPFQATLEMPSGYSVTVRSGRVAPGQTQGGRMMIEFTRPASSGATNNAMRFVAERR